MSKPRALGYIAQHVVNESANRLAQNRKAAVDALMHNFHGDKDAVAECIKVVAENDAVAWQALILLASGQLHEAQELILGSGKS